MNTFMYGHPLTSEHIRVVQDTLKYTVMGPIGKELACGDVGMYTSLYYIFCFVKCYAGVGAMLEWSQIVDLVVDHFQLEN